MRRKKSKHLADFFIEIDNLRLGCSLLEQTTQPPLKLQAGIFINGDRRPFGQRFGDRVKTVDARDFFDKIDGDKAMAAFKGMKIDSPRGAFTLSKAHNPVQDIYLRKVEKKDGQLYNVEFDVIKDVKDPGKAR